MSDFFRAHQAIGTPVPTYFIESTAPDNVDDTAADKPVDLPNLTPINSDQAVRDIATALVNGANPNLVVMVHGFNNPEPAVLATYTAAAMAIARDRAVSTRQGLVCVGYRWPSEKMGQPIQGTWDALPTLPTWILYLGAALAVLPFLLFYLVPDAHWPADMSRFFHNPGVDHVVTMAGLTFAGLVLTAALLRTIVYFRDNYRASNYGVPDLVQIIRAIDTEIVRQRGGGKPKNDVELSFIGHSMGGFVVTNTIRVLSDVFVRPVRSLSSYGAGSSPDDTPDQASQNIGNVFSLKRFVLVSPDIPAETLLSSRGNFLASALSRFDEAYLFSNEGDEVLRQISTLANYFVFPTKSRKHGFRLGNLEILSSKYGLLDVAEADFLRVLRIGNLTLQELYDALETAKAKRQATAGPAPTQASLPKVFTYFDCTDYVEPAAGQPKSQGLLTFAKCRKRTDPNAKLRWYSHLYLLGAYLFRHQKPNVHGGYFEGELSQELIYRLACLGYRDTVAAYGGADPLSQACKDKQIRGLLSPQFATRSTLRQRTTIEVVKSK
jgi:pimeloyl-ACP methyl ester carboxylesterase